MDSYACTISVHTNDPWTVGILSCTLGGYGLWTSMEMQDIHGLFVEYNKKYFDQALGTTTVEWSRRMTLCAGLCYLKRQGTARYCVIRLSLPLLTSRGREDTRSTLLHEMIHAYLWIRTGCLDHDGHGPEFLTLAARIGKLEGIAITVYHSFHEQVAEARKHVWKCNGPCRFNAPYFGLVRRSMNRPPQPADRWWNDHQRSCGGQFTKISSPPQGGTNDSGIQGKKTLTDYWSGLKRPNFVRDQRGNLIQCPACRDHLADSPQALDAHLDECLQSSSGTSCPSSTKHCPVCGSFETPNLDLLNDHIDQCIDQPEGITKRSVNPSNSITVIDLT